MIGSFRTAWSRNPAPVRAFPLVLWLPLLFLVGIVVPPLLFFLPLALGLSLIFISMHPDSGAPARPRYAAAAAPPRSPPL
jgi:hypothetical protein